MRGNLVDRSHPADPGPESAGSAMARPGSRAARPGAPTGRLRRTTSRAEAGVLSGATVNGSASAAANPYQRGPNPTVASVAATHGPFATAQLTVRPGHGFNGGTIYYPTDISQGTWGAIAIVPGHAAVFAREEAWMGPRLASFGIVVIGIETISREDRDTARGNQLLAALDYLTQCSPVRERIDPDRLAVIGHSMGGGGAFHAASQRPPLKAAIGLVPLRPTGDLSGVRVPTLVQGGADDTVVTPSYLNSLYATLPAGTPSAFVQLAGADHLFWTRANDIELRTQVPWLKIFVDNDRRYAPLVCPTLADTTGVSQYSVTCATMPGTGPPPPLSSPLPPTDPPPVGCTASYRTIGWWPGGFQGEVTVTAGASRIEGWTVSWTFADGQTINHIWDGSLTTDGRTVSVTNASDNGSLPPSASTTFGFLASGPPAAPPITCTSR
jgi:dienelactone hydrolase